MASTQPGGALYFPDVNVLVRAAHALHAHYLRTPDADRSQTGVVEFLTSSGDDRLIDLGVAISTGTLVSTPLVLRAAVNKTWETSEQARVRAANRQAERKPATDPDVTTIFPSEQAAADLLLKGLVARRLMAPITDWAQIRDLAYGAYFTAAKEFEASTRSRAGAPRLVVTDPTRKAPPAEEGLVDAEDLGMYAMAEHLAVYFDRPVIFATSDKNAALVAWGIDLGDVTLYQLQHGRWARRTAAARTMTLTVAAGSRGIER